METILTAISAVTGVGTLVIFWYVIRQYKEYRSDTNEAYDKVLKLTIDSVKKETEHLQVAADRDRLRDIVKKQEQTIENERNARHAAEIQRNVYLAELAKRGDVTALVDSVNSQLSLLKTKNKSSDNNGNG